MKEIILASGSPRRKEILQWANIPFAVKIPETDESHPPGLSPEQVAVHIARNKAWAVNKMPGHKKAVTSLHSRPVLAADTIVVLDDEIIGKPADRNDAITILQKLSGKKHRVITGVVILYKGSEIVFADITEVEFYKLSIQQIEYYIDNYKPFDKAGAYAIQEWIGVVGIKSINGDFYNVMGLPVSRVLIALKELEY